MEGYKFTTWDETVTCAPELYFQPSNLEELREVLTRARENGRRVKVCGSHHSFNTMSCTEGYLIDLHKFNRVVDVDNKKHTIKVEAGITLTELNQDVLPKHGLGWSVMSGVSHQSLAGAISTPTHGSGSSFGILASYIVQLEIMKSSGDIIRCTREENPDEFSAACCGLGALGIIVSATIQCEPAFRLHAKTKPMKFDHAVENLNHYVSSNEHAQFVWMLHTDDVVLEAYNRTDQLPTPPQKSSWFLDTLVGYYGFQTLYWLWSDFLWNDSKCELIPALHPWINWALIRLWCSHLTDRVATSHEIFVYQFYIVPEYSVEWFIPRDKVADVLHELKKHADQRTFYSNSDVFVRFVKADDVMISPAYKKDVCVMNITHKKPFGNSSTPRNHKYFRTVEDVIRRAGGMPHMGKINAAPRNQDNERYFPQWRKFCDVRKKMDPDGLFLNEFLEKCITD